MPGPSGVGGKLIVWRLGHGGAQYLSHRGPGGGGVTRMGRDPRAGLGRAAERRAIAPDRGHFRPRAAPEGIWKHHIANCYYDNGKLWIFRTLIQLNAMFGSVNFG